MKPLIHFAHANGVPSKVYEKLFHLLRDDYDIVYVPLIGTDQRYPVTNHWPHLVDQLIDSIVRQAHGRPVIGLGHSLGSVLTMMTAYRRPELFQQVIMLDPPLIMGKASLLFHTAKLLQPKLVDRMTPAGLSNRRRDHWESREQAGEMLRPKSLYQKFDPECFQAYLDHALTEDAERGGITLTIPKAAEVAIFRNTPSWWWLPMSKPKVPMHLVVGDQSEFLKHKFPQVAKKKVGIPFSVAEGGHMFPLERPEATVESIKQLIQQQQK